MLEAAGDITVVGESGSAAECIARIPALRPNVAVLDGRLPDGSGIDVCREVREDREIERQDFVVTTSNKQLNFLQHIMTILDINGR